MPGRPTVQQLFPGPESAHTELSYPGSTMTQINVSFGAPGTTLVIPHSSAQFLKQLSQVLQY